MPTPMRSRLHFYHVGVNETGANGAADSAWLDAARGKGGGAPASAPPPPVQQNHGVGQRLQAKGEAAPASFLRTLRERATPGDFVVVKVPSRQMDLAGPIWLDCRLTGWLE